VKNRLDFFHPWMRSCFSEKLAGGLKKSVFGPNSFLKLLFGGSNEALRGKIRDMTEANLLIK